MKRWECAVCGHIHSGETPPSSCPVCGASADKFVLFSEADSPPVAAEGKKIIIVGAGIAGYSAAQEIRALSPDSDIHLFNDEPDLPYWRMNLTRVLAGELSREQLPLQGADWYKKQAIQLHNACCVTRILAEEKRVVDETGQAHGYDGLILCSGARAHRPALYPQSEAVLTLRSQADLRRIEAALDQPRRIICLGGGVLGVECAAALAGRGHRVSLVYIGSRLMPRQLGPSGAGRLTTLLQDMGVHTRSTPGILKVQPGPPLRMFLSDGGEVEGDLLLLTTGIEPCAPTSDPVMGLPCPVDQRMRTPLPDIWSAGDVCIQSGHRFGSWGAAQQQGQAAARFALGLDEGPVNPLPSCLVKIVQPEIVSLGDILHRDEMMEQNRPDFLISLFFCDGRLCGANLFNASRFAGVINRAVAGGWDLSPLRRQRMTAWSFLEALSERYAND